MPAPRDRQELHRQHPLAQPPARPEEQVIPRAPRDPCRWPAPSAAGGDLESLEAKAKSYELGRKFMKEFASRVGAGRCEEILRFNLGTPEGFKRAQEAKLFETRCLDAVKAAADIIEDLLGPRQGMNRADTSGRPPASTRVPLRAAAAQDRLWRWQPCY